MPLIAGSSLGPYQIIAPLGAGGMGEERQSSVARHPSSVVRRTRDMRL